MSSLEAQAAERKARLAALRNKNKPQTNTTQQFNTSATLPTIKPRNFDPEQRQPIQGSDKPPTALDENSETVEAVSQQIQEQVLAKFRERAHADSTTLGERIKPKKATLDLERDLKDDLDLLEERTDEVLKAMVKEKIRQLKMSAAEEA